MMWGLNCHQSKGVLTEIHNYWLIQLANRIMSIEVERARDDYVNY